MAQPTTVRPGKMRILLGDGGSPEVFSAPCGLTTKAIRVSKDLSDVLIPDCDDPDAAGWLARDVTSLSIEITGEGLLAAESEALWMDATFSADPVNVKVEVEFTTGTRTLEGAFHVTVSTNGQQGQRVSIDVSMQSDGIVSRTWTPA